MADLNSKDAPLVKDQDPFNEDYRDLREKVVLRVSQATVATADAGAVYDSSVQALINELKATVNSLIGKLE